jgi:hypothetical protein
MQKTGLMLCLILLLSVLNACEKEVHIKLTSKDKLIVIEGNIETNQQPYVYLTNSIGFFDRIDLDAVSYINNAIVTVQDLNTDSIVQLKEYNIDTVIGGTPFSLRIYAPDINDPVAFAFKGQVNHSYKLTVITDGKTFESVTKIPTGNGLDSLWTEKVANRDSFRTLHAIYVDPDTFGNSVRVQTLVRKATKTGEVERYQSGFNSVYNDDIVNGVRLPIFIQIGYDKTRNYSQAEFKNLGLMRKGDTVTVKWSAIDKKVFTFWETLDYSQGSIGNPFASPAKIQSNIQGALGVWAGYNAKEFTIVDTLK